jgi:hypothetical protein
MTSHFHSAFNQHDACFCPESEALEAIFNLLSDLDLDDNSARIKALEHFDAAVAGLARAALMGRGPSQAAKSTALLKKACADGAETIKQLCDLQVQGAPLECRQMAVADARFTQQLLAALGALGTEPTE